MFEEKKQQINDYRKTRKVLNVTLATVKLAVAYVLITYIDFGIFVALGYILYALENSSGLQFINSQEIDLQLNILHERINELEGNTNK